MRVRPVALALLATAATAACATSIDALAPPPVADGATPGAVTVGAGGFGPGVPVSPHPWPPASALDAFRRFEGPCSQHSASAGRGDDRYPRVEPDRFADAVVVRDLAPGATLIVDGRGTPLVVAGWDGGGTLLAASGRPDDPLPDPYRLGCPERPTVEQPQTAPGT